MRSSGALLATFIAVTASSIAAFKPFVDIVKVISNEAESDVKLSHKLKAVKSSKDAVLDAPLDLSCTVGDHAEIEQCSWRRDDGPHLYVRGGGVVDGHQNVVEGLTVNQTNPRYEGEGICRVSQKIDY